MLTTTKGNLLLQCFAKLFSMHQKIKRVWWWALAVVRLRFIVHVGFAKKFAGPSFDDKHRRSLKAILATYQLTRNFLKTNLYWKINYAQLTMIFSLDEILATILWISKESQQIHSLELLFSCKILRFFMTSNYSTFHYLESIKSWHYEFSNIVDLQSSVFLF